MIEGPGVVLDAGAFIALERRDAMMVQLVERFARADNAHIVLLARERGWPVITSDPDDLRAIDPTLRIEEVGGAVKQRRRQRPRSR